ncbi:MAG: hypothetical protein M3R04_10605, partial [bacterium]|nr:hypothetical protein [bacterium]
IEDTTTGDFLILEKPNSPTIVVGEVNDVVIVEFGPLDFANGPVLGENIFTYLQTAPGEFTYSDMLFTPAIPEPQRIWMTTGVNNNFNVGGNSAQFTREQGNFLFGENKQRPYAYRRNAGGGRVRIYGYNFGLSGEIHLNATSFGPGDIVVPDSNIAAWNVDIDGNPADPSEAGYIDFVMPLDQKHAGGKFLVANDALLDNPVAPTTGFGVSASALVVSPLITSTAPNPVKLTTPDDLLTILGFDLSAPKVPGITGDQTYMFFVVQADYTDPFNADAPTQDKVLLINPFPVTVINTNTIQFMLSTLPTAANSANIEVHDSTGTQYLPDTGTLDVGSYSYFLWTGVLPTNGTISGSVLANSGIISEFRDFNVAP